MNYDAIRKLISTNQTLPAFNLILEEIDNLSYQTAFVQLKSEWLNWKKEYYRGLGPEDVYKHRINNAMLVLLSEYEEIDSQPSKRQELLFKYEQALGQKLAYLLTLDKKQRIDKVIEEVKKCNTSLFDTIQHQSIHHYQLNKMLDKGASETILEKKLDQVKQKLKISFDVIQEDFPNQQAYIDTLKKLLVSDPSYLAKWLIETEHKKANIQLLWKQVNDLQEKYQQIKTASIFGLLGFLLSNQLSSEKVSIFGKNYDEQGYDNEGFDFLDFDRNGYSRNGEHQFEAISLENIPDLNAEIDSINMNVETVSYDLDIDLSID